MVETLYYENMLKNQDMILSNLIKDPTIIVIIFALIYQGSQDSKLEVFTLEFCAAV